jgi:hypothetical protein
MLRQWLEEVAQLVRLGLVVGSCEVSVDGGGNSLEFLQEDIQAQAARQLGVGPQPRDEHVGGGDQGDGGASRARRGPASPEHRTAFQRVLTALLGALAVPGINGNHARRTAVFFNEAAV